MSKLDELNKQELPGLKIADEVATIIYGTAFRPVVTKSEEASPGFWDNRHLWAHCDIWNNSTPRDGVREIRLRIWSGSQAQVDEIMAKVKTMLENPSCPLPQSCWYFYSFSGHNFSYRDVNSGKVFGSKKLNGNCLKIFYQVDPKRSAAAVKGIATARANNKIRAEEWAKTREKWGV